MWIELLNISALVAIMFSMGLKSRFEDVMASARRSRLVLQGLVANFVLVPAVTVGLLWLFNANPLVSVGFLILAVCPGAPVGPPFSAIAKGDVPYSIGLMVILAVLSAVLSPMLLGHLLGWLVPESDLQIDSQAIVRTLLVFQVLPVAVGLSLQRWARTGTQRIVKPVSLLANLLLVLVLVLILATQYPTLAAIRLRGWTGMLLLLGASLGIGWVLGGPDQATRKTLALTTAARNAAVGLVMVSSSFAGTPAVTAVVAYALASILGALACAVMLGRLTSPRP